MEKNKLFYTEDHEWVQLLDDNKVRIGITDYAVEQLGDIVYVEVPEMDETYDLEESFANIESVKSTSEIYAPIAGTVTLVNETLEDEPENVNEDPYEIGWICEMTSENAVDTSHLISLEEYTVFINKD
ncbi:glycine cleavage system protein GcvH [Aerococcaceae bacterium DSM 111021]|nr:glycine cleavage system protein GcvH [Aerococcaceae bacterium DSM 111021]